MFFIALTYTALLFIIKFFLKGNLYYYTFYAATLFAGSNLLKDDTSLELIFLLYASCPLIFLLKTAFKSSKFFRRYLYLLLCFLIIIIKHFFSLSKDRNISKYLIPEGFKRFIYPENWEEWFYFLSYYIGELANSIFIIPFLIFALIFLYLIFIPIEKKYFNNINYLDYLGSLFFIGYLFSLLSKKSVFYITPLISCVTILTSWGLYLITSKKIKYLLGCILIAVQLLAFFSFSFKYNISYISGEPLLRNYNLKTNEYGETISNSFLGLCHNLREPTSETAKNYKQTKKEIFLNIGAAKNFKEALKKLNLERFFFKSALQIDNFKETQIVNKLIDKELAVLEYVLEKKIVNW
jgi:hypothetical protein